MTNNDPVDSRGTHNRRRFISLAGAVAVGTTGLAGCLGESSAGPPVAEAEPLGSPVSSTAVTWDDLGDLEGDLSIYSGRTRDQINPVFQALENEYDDFSVEVDWDDSDVHVHQIITEGDSTAADLMYSQDPGALNELAEAGVIQELPGDVVEAVDESYRSPDGMWTGVTGRVRSIQYNSERLPFDEDEMPTDILEFATDERFEDIISTRPNSGTFRGFVQAMVDRKGENTTREWISDMVEQQNAQLFSGGSTQAEEINRGADGDPIVGLGNSYYTARILNENPDAPIRATFTEGDAGCLFSVAGVAATNAVSDPDLVAEFVRHLLAVEGQEFMMDANGEYPVVEGVDYVGELPDLEDINPPSYDLTAFDMSLSEANDLIRQEGMAV